MLTDKMKQWAMLKQQLDQLQHEITEEILVLEKTQAVENVVASYTKGRRQTDYEGVAKAIEIDQAIVLKHTTPKTDWRSVCKEVQPPQDVVKQFTKIGDPTVSLKLVTA